MLGLISEIFWCIIDSTTTRGKKLTMGIVELFLLALGLSADAFAVSVCAGPGMQKFNKKRALLVGVYFGSFQAGMPVIGFLAASSFAGAIAAYAHWVAFGLLCFIGGKMIIESLKKDGPCEEFCLKPKKMLPLAVATSIDALAVGVSMALMEVNIVFAASLIGLTTLLISMAGVKIGSIFGIKYKNKASLAGGVILLLIGLRILIEHFL